MKPIVVLTFLFIEITNMQLALGTSAPSAWGQSPTVSDSACQLGRALIQVIPPAAMFVRACASASSDFVVNTALPISAQAARGAASGLAVCFHAGVEGFHAGLEGTRRILDAVSASQMPLDVQAGSGEPDDEWTTIDGDGDADDDDGDADDDAVTLRASATARVPDTEASHAKVTEGGDTQ